MKHPTPEQKHSILTHWSARRTGETLNQILALHDVTASRQAVVQWQRQWDGTVVSLQQKQKTGRPHKLSKAQISRHIAAPIRNANRASRPITYPKLLLQVQAATDTEISLRTIQRYGKEELGVKSKKGVKRTSDECK